jgi:hypothetical protein
MEWVDGIPPPSASQADLLVAKPLINSPGSQTHQEKRLMPTEYEVAKRNAKLLWAIAG